jgi:hypothetical protein
LRAGFKCDCEKEGSEQSAEPSEVWNCEFLHESSVSTSVLSDWRAGNRVIENRVACG